MSTPTKTHSNSTASHLLGSLSNDNRSSSIADLSSSISRSGIPDDKNTNNNSSLLATTDVADLIRQLDVALGDSKSSILAGAVEAQEARKNAYMAGELARRFSLTAIITNGWTNGNKSNTSSSENWSILDPKTTKAGGGIAFTPTTAAASYYGNQSAASSSIPVIYNFQNTASSQSEAGGKFHPHAPNSNNHKDASPPSRQNTNNVNKGLERLAATHAEELLSVSLELERTKQLLETEQMRHDETKSALHQAKTKACVVEEQREQLLERMETAREESGRRMDELEHDLEKATLRIQTAEQEATSAFDICLQADEARDQSDRNLQRALQEIKTLKDYITQHLPVDDYLNDEQEQQDQNFLRRSTSKGSERKSQSRSVRFQDEAESAFMSSAISNTTSDRPTHALVARGRQIMHRYFSSDRDSAPFVVPHHPSTVASSERGQRLRQRLENTLTKGSNTSVASRSLDEEESVAATLRASRSPSDQSRQDLSSAVDALDICRNAAHILKKSGQRLNLSGRWFTTNETNVPSHASVTDDIHLENLAKHYTTMVEVRDCAFILNEKLFYRLPESNFYCVTNFVFHHCLPTTAGPIGEKA